MASDVGVWQRRTLKAVAEAGMLTAMISFFHLLQLSLWAEFRLASVELYSRNSNNVAILLSHSDMDR
jgi:hypothetical protein